MYWLAVLERFGMSKDEDEINEESFDRDFLTEALENSGYTVIDLESLQAVIDAMERQIMHETNIDTQEELEFYLNKIEELLGSEEAQKLDINQVIGWVKTLKDI